MNIPHLAARVVFKLLRITHTGRLLSDKLYISILYRMGTGEKMHWNNPRTFTEKLQWEKVFLRDPRMPLLVDKVAVKKYVADIIGEEYIIPTLGGDEKTYEKAENIDWDSLPDQFVLKCNHDSGSVCVCKDKKTFNKEAAIKKLNAAMKKGSFYWYAREWAYKNVTPCIFAEKFLEDESGKELKDYKFYCFNGEPLLAEVFYDRFEQQKRNFYNTNWEKLEMTYRGVPSVRDIECPQNFEEMLQLARKLSKGWPFLRVDFYSVSGKTYFGELTFYPAAGSAKFAPSEWNLRLGELITLPEVKK